MSLYYVDGHYLDAEKAALPLTDLAIMRGFGVFDFLRTYNGKPFHLNDHLIRLQESAAQLYLPFRWSIGELTGIVNTLLNENSYEESNIRLLITGGDAEDSITPPDNPRLIVMVTPVRMFPEQWYTDGVKIITSNVTRYVPGAKSINYTKAILALRKAHSLGAIESIYVNENNQLLEGTTSNLFVVMDETVVTPDRGILPGITRKVVLELAKQKCAVRYGAITGDMVSRCQEIFITSSNKEVVPVVMVDDFRISNGPGPITETVMELFKNYTQNW